MRKCRKMQNALIVAIMISLLIPFSHNTISSNPYTNLTTGFPLGWSEDVRLTHTNYTSRCNQPSIAITSQYLHLVWGQSYRVPPGDWFSEVKYARSIDGGETWDLNKNITEVDGYYSYVPDIDVSNSALHIIWNDARLGKKEIFYRNSTDSGETWSDEILISPNDNEHSQNPSIAVSNSNVHVVWEDSRDDAVGLFEIYYKRSTDGGITWDDGLGNIGQDRRLTTNLGWNDVSSYITVDDDIVHVIWTKRTSSFDRWETMYTRSLDNGATWEGPVMLTEEDTWHSHGQAISIGDSGDVHVLWTEYKYGTEDVCYRNSTNNGATWNPEVRLNANANESEQPDIAVNSSHVLVTWMDDRNHYDWEGSISGAFELYYIESFDGGTTWGDEARLTYAVNNSIRPCVAMDTDYIHIAWMDNRTPIPSEKYSEDYCEIFYKRFPDFPDTTPPDHSNETPLPDSYKDAPGTNISVHVTDPSGVNESTIQFYVNGSLVSHNLSPITDGYNVSYISPGFDPGVVICRIVADDNLSNHLDFTWNFTVLAIYEIQLHEGWNLISVPHVQVDTSINEVLRDIDGKWNYIQWYDASDGTDHWKSYATFKPESLNDLSKINRSMAFWINITEPNVNLTVRGLYPGSTTIPLYRGWNLVGYPSLNTETVGNALFGTTADRVEVCDISEPYNIREVGPTYIMKPGEGYWIHVVANSVWVVDW